MVCKIVSMNGLTKAIEKAGGQSALASHLGISTQVVHNWTRRGNVPPEYAPVIEDDFGVPASELCPAVPWDRIRNPKRDAA
jgi:DNA-binding transcriptional regulator YdaS (Cro superfamily)